MKSGGGGGGTAGNSLSEGNAMFLMLTLQRDCYSINDFGYR